MALLKFIQKNHKNLRKIFGQQELKIIEKQILGAPLAPSETTRLSRDIRQKFKIIKELSEFKEEFDLKKAALIKQNIQETIKIIKETKYFPQIKKIILFGSAVENRLRLDSDIDIAVEFSKINLREATKFRLRIIRSVSEKVDIQVYNTLPEKIKKEIDKKGKVIWKKE